MVAAASSSRSSLFITSFAAIVATSFCFILRSMVIGDWGDEFALSETQKGELLGAGLWPFAITIVLFSLLIDRIGFELTFWFACACHVSGLVILLTAQGYWPLYIGTFIMALGNGAVEAAANPLVATVYSEDKPKWLNRLHAAWPLGLILGGVLAIALGSGVDWRIKVALMAAPIAVYAFLLLARKFPVSERVASGVSYKEMLAEAGAMSALVIIALMMLEVGRVAGLGLPVVLAVIFVLTAAYAWVSRSAGRPLYIIFVLLMIPLAITELSTDSWITELMEPEMSAIGLQAGWVLVYTSAIMFVMRMFAGPVLHRLKPLGVLAMASGVAAAGIFLLSGATGLALLAAATLYGIGKSFFWGTSLAIASEQFPKGGAVTLNVMAGAGMLAAGIVGTVMLGSLQDAAIARGLNAHDSSVGASMSSTYLVERQGLLGSYQALDSSAVSAAPAADQALIGEITRSGKKEALRDVALVPIFMMLCYLGLIAFFRSRGGYKPVVLAAQPRASGPGVEASAPASPAP
ncbi:MFS transporter [bacterium]|nr:MFS transporter [bacterium]